MTRIRINSYKPGSRSASALAAAIPGCRVLRAVGSTFRPRPRDLIINWGSSAPINSGGARVLNDPAAVAVASNKLRSFEAFRTAGVSIPDFWTRREDIPDGSTPGETSAFPVVCRTVLSGHSGAGIVIADTPEQLVQAPLYVRYVPKQDEYRIHVFAGNVIATQRKARRLDVENPDWRVRNHGNGFVFARDGVVAPEPVVLAAVASCAALGLDFGGVDVIWNERRQAAYVLEINTACGLEGATVDDYARAVAGVTPVA